MDTSLFFLIIICITFKTLGEGENRASSISIKYSSRENRVHFRSICFLFSFPLQALQPPSACGKMAGAGGASPDTSCSISQRILQISHPKRRSVHQVLLRASCRVERAGQDNYLAILSQIPVHHIPPVGSSIEKKFFNILFCPNHI